MNVKRKYIYFGIAVILAGIVILYLNKHQANKELSIDKLDKNITNEDTFKKSKYPLLAEIPEKNFYVYGMNDNTDNYKGIIVRYGNELKNYDIKYMTPMFVLPKLKVIQIGQQDIILCSFNTESGSEVYIEDLYGFYQDSKNSLNIMNFSADNYKKQLNEAINYKLQSDNVLDIIINNKDLYDIDLNNFNDSNWNFEKISYGNNVSFSFDSGINITLGIEAYFTNIVTPQYIGTIKADVVINEDKSFILDNIKVEK
ncbi:hypothetical protein LAD12857_39330 [Lacrimispora amygdalina]|uniref:Uncharacterized protein n=1 Tax=Lacrimispora amygdalina TaxID=253257 RepID=A0A3E2NJ09_9FIRM|nr:hypothetical protein [Clostridium indicum]RFZ80969.1 hypothetical protein DS742_00480 [Clostridium indicum]